MGLHRRDQQLAICPLLRLKPGAAVFAFTSKQSKLVPMATLPSGAWPFLRHGAGLRLGRLHWPRAASMGTSVRSSVAPREWPERVAM